MNSSLAARSILLDGGGPRLDGDRRINMADSAGAPKSARSLGGRPIVRAAGRHQAPRRRHGARPAPVGVVVPPRSEWNAARGDGRAREPCRRTEGGRSHKRRLDKNALAEIDATAASQRTS